MNKLYLYVNTEKGEIELIIGDETLIIDKLQEDENGNFLRVLGGDEQKQIIKKLVKNL